MPKMLKAFAVLGVTVILAACASDNDDDIVIVDPITVDPVTTKF
ncbi:hypothetical protein [Jannaschia sp. LMIT008]|nr:hypothetical protein [Jannaschia sp. LMIT008]